MERQRFRNIISIILFSCDLVLTKEVIYKTSGSEVKLVCPIETTRDITWTGPPGYTLYAVGTDVSLRVSTLVEIKKTDTDKKSILIIHHFTEAISGEFRCDDGVKDREFNLVIKRNPSDLVMVNATGNTITTVEGREHYLKCRVTSAQPGGNITLSTDGVVVSRNGPSFVGYRMIPQRSDNGKLFKCEAFNSDGESILESSVSLIVFYIPKITFRPKQTLTVKESEETQLICINDGNDPGATSVWKRPGINTIITQNDKLTFKSINRTDAGLYTCRIDTQAGVYANNATVIVQYAPTIKIRYYPYERKMKCIPSGVPDRYIFKDWEHTTEYNDHIRFLPIAEEGNNTILTIPTNVSGKDRHRDRGKYICRASNNISSTDGMFVMQEYNLDLNGAPYFVSSTENTQYGVYLKTTRIKIKFVSVPEYNNYYVYKKGTKFANFTPTVHRNMKLTDDIYGKNVSVKGTIISLQIQINTLDDFSSYNIVVKNAIGYSNHTFKLVSASAPFLPTIFQTIAKQRQIFVFWIPGFDGGYLQWFIVEYKKIGDIYWKNQTTRSSNSIVIFGLQPATLYLIQMFSRNLIDDSNRTGEIIIKTDKYTVVETLLSIQSIVILSLVIIMALLMAGMGLYIRRLKQRHRESMESAINVLTLEGSHVESAHYTEIIEADNLHRSSEENSIMSMIIRDIDIVSAEQTSTSSDNDRDSTEYLDDGYEQPYTTLVLTDLVKEDHIYLNTKKESNYENTIPTQIVACGHAGEFLEKDCLSDKSNDHEEHENLNLNFDVNVKNERVPQIYIYPQRNKAEYVNLSLNQ